MTQLRSYQKLIQPNVLAGLALTVFLTGIAWRFPFGLPFLAAWLAYVVWRPLAANAWPASRWPIIGVTARIFAVGLLDFCLLNALPILGLSFGAVGFPLLGLTLVRVFFFLAAAWLVMVAQRRRSRAPIGSRQASKRPITGASPPQEARGNLPSLTARAHDLVPALFGLGLCNAALLILVIDSLYIEPFNLQTTRLALPGPGMADRPLRIAHLSDLHIERLTRRETDLLERLHAYQPDFIFLTGDYLNVDALDDPLAQRDLHTFLASLHALFGVYAVSGTVDQASAITAAISGTDVIWLQDEARRFAFGSLTLYLMGISNEVFGERDHDQTALEQLVSQARSGSSQSAGVYTVLLYHTPDLIEAAAAEGVNLYLAGHTHGGQVRLPFYGALISFSAYGKRFESGQYTLGATTMYVSRGIGMEGWGLPRARFLCPPELVLIDLAP